MSLNSYKPLSKPYKMNNKLSTLFTILLLLVGSYHATASTDTIKVLFIGNSITYFNNMPFMFDSIAHAKGKNVQVTVYAPGGTGFVNHAVDPSVFSLFRNSMWDIVVLQPGSGESPGVSFPVNTTIQRGRILLDSIYNYSPCARVYLYEIPYGVPSATTYSTYFTVQQAIRDSVKKMSDSLYIPMIPAGECARAYYTMYQNLLLHSSFNDIHPNANGSLLIASAFYTGIFQDTVSGCSYHSSIQVDTARKFFNIVDTVVLNHLNNWNINTYNLHAHFSSSMAGTTVNFTNLSINYTRLRWDFGDGNISVATNPVHTYAAPGVYNVKLYAFNRMDCVDSITMSINIAPLTIHTTHAELEQVIIYPNPVADVLYINKTTVEVLDYKIINALGNTLQSGKLSDTLTPLDVATLPKGVYMLQLSRDRIGRSRVFVVE